MRLKALDLVRYGKFTDRRLDFGESLGIGRDFHVVYGPNEAGKSTLFSAYLDLLFGIEARSGYGFLHPYPTMRVGGTIETGERTHEVFRVKRNQNTLIDADDRPLPDTLFSAALAGIDRAAYQMMFSLDDDSIERGGEAILKSEGELGALLFSASSGLPDSSVVLARLRAEAETFYKPRGSKHRLAELKAELEVLKEKKADADTNAREFAALRKARDSAAERHETALTARAEMRVGLDRLRVQREALPLLGRLRRSREELADFGDLPEAPSPWYQLYPTLLREDADIAGRIQQLDADIERRENEIAAIVEDQAALAAAGRLEDIERSGLKARFRTAVYDMPSRLDERAKVEADMAARLRQLGQADGADASAFLIPVAVIGRIQDLSQQHAALKERLVTAEQELSVAQEASSEIEATYPGAGDEEYDGNGLRTIADLARRLRQNDCLLRQQAARRQAAGLQDMLEERLAALSPFAGDADALSRLPVPTAAELAMLAAERLALEERRQRLDDRIGEEEAALAGDRARLDKLHRAAPFAADDQALALRHARDEAWTAHSAVLDGRSAARFEAAMRRDDEAVALRSAQADSVAQARVLTLSLAERTARVEAWRNQKAALVTTSSELSDRIGIIAIACGLPRETGLARLEQWFAARVVALETRTTRRNALQDLRQAEEDEASGLEKLAEALQRLDGDLSLPDDLAGALDIVERTISDVEKKLATRREAAIARQRAEAALVSRQVAFDAADLAMTRWVAQWREALAGTWLATGDNPPSPGEILPALALSQDIEKLAQKRADLDHRIDGMAKDQCSFTSAVEEIGRTLEISSDGDALSLFERLLARVSEATRCRDLATRLGRENGERRHERQALLEKRVLQETQKSVMLAHFGCETLSEVGARLDAVKLRDRLRERIAETETDLCARLSVARVEEAELVLSAVDEEGLDLATVERQAAFDQMDRDVGDLHAERREAEQLLLRIGGDDTAAHMEERRRTVLAEIEARAVAYLRLRTGIVAGEAALRLYRERHRSAMMQRASAAFSMISGGEYDGLSTQAERGEEYLIANAAGGGSKLARDLSKGTRFQLYLALRMAGYHEIAATRESLPFVADDIMETFDDGRARNAFSLMGEMAKVGQVIYLTHHEHLCEIAQKACPGVVVHRL
ncbi:uncharacterized protein YhaN [Pararhizobium capsulatum DSM 1112]|uniref:Uncharacterized protein YhaN n=1 Tax=Pararhizobium capsulatum DSM 1112 TaxID=1121113 RepID=A0ABU0BPK2_9HYPH|nr:AAA family ATPase [Pararhizobium capsulatum]MDQ0319892.1 uncharacterized protein YhaN [Pararhizobium capsulatum DSM 1112]